MTYVMVDVKKNFYEDSLLSLLALSVYNPTLERLRERVKKYSNSYAHVYAYTESENYSDIVVFTLNHNKITINNIATLERKQGNGIATRMLDFLLEQFQASEIIAETDDDAVGFYRKYGFSTSICGQINGITRYKCVFVKATPCYCGHDCSRCLTYLATVNNDNDLREKSQRFYKDEEQVRGEKLLSPVSTL